MASSLLPLTKTKTSSTTTTTNSNLLMPFSHPKKTLVFALYGFMLFFIISTFFIIFNPSPLLLKNLISFRNPLFTQDHFPNLSPPPSNLGNNSNNNVSSGVLVVPPSSQPQGSDGNDDVSKGPSSSSSSSSWLGCDLFDGKWVRDESYPMYAPGSCPHIDELFNCFLNHRPDNAYENFRWQPHACNIPRLNGTHMLELLKGKRLAFVGDSLNRNMWESLVCVLRNSVENKSRVFEASGREEFRSEGSYSFIFSDYNCSIEFFKTNFLVQEWEMPGKNGSKEETLRLDLLERSWDRYKDADVLIFNTGHWWSHEKLTIGKDYFQEGSHVYSQLDMFEAFRRALTTWASWVDANMDPKKAQIFFRGYSASHFGGGEWNSGGTCDKETKPAASETNMPIYIPYMEVLEGVIKWMKMPVFYLNVTSMTDFRVDAHPAIYRAPHLTDEERHSPLRYQDCSHWCLPGVPDTWNELVYAQMLIRHHQMLEEEQRERHYIKS